MGAEKAFENKVKDYLKSQNAWYIKYWGGAKYTKSGIPDILANICGYFVAIELKAPSGKPSHLQLRTIRRIRDAHGIAIVLYPKDFDKFKELCESLKRGMYSEADDLQYYIDNTLKLKDEERGILYGKSLRDNR